jgi:PAS domain S-box-containing protein
MSVKHGEDAGSSQADLLMRENAIQSALSAVAVADLEGRITFVNPSFLRMWRYEDAGEVLGRDAAEFWERDADGGCDVPAAAMNGGWVGEHTARRSDGTPFEVQVAASVLMNGEGASVGTMASFLDISARRHAEEQARLYSAQLEIANRDLESFARSVSHDLQAPLRSIDGFSRALLEDYGDEIDEEGRSHLCRVRAGAQRMAALIEGLLELSRVASPEMTWKEVDLSALVRTIAAELAETAREREVEFVIPEDMTVKGDAQLLRIILSNLLGNAWKFTGGNARARIEFGAVDYEDESAFFVRDNGVGFDMAYRDKLFGAFQRLHPADEFEGTGIGLATVRRAVLRHGGRAWAEGEVNKGATFHFTLGCRMSGAGNSVTGKPLSVLIVEDVEDDALLVVRELKRGGYDPVFERVDTAGAMRAALGEGDWDVVMCDCSMPGFGALAAIGLLHEMERDMPIIAMSGTVGEDIGATLIEAGAHDFLTKGNLSGLVPVVERQIREWGTRRERRQAAPEAVSPPERSPR